MVIGLIDAQVWNRDKGGPVTPRRSRGATADKELQRWLNGPPHKPAKPLTEANSITVVSDQESDITSTLPKAIQAMLIFWFGPPSQPAKSRLIPTATGSPSYWGFVDSLPEQGRFKHDNPSRTGTQSAHRGTGRYALAGYALCRPKLVAARRPAKDN